MLPVMYTIKALSSCSKFRVYFWALRVDFIYGFVDCYLCMKQSRKLLKWIMFTKDLNVSHLLNVNIVNGHLFNI